MPKEGDILETKQGNTIYLANKGDGMEEIIRLAESGKPVKIVCYGNSITYGWEIDNFGQVETPYPKKLEQLFKKKYPDSDVEVINEGHNGWRSDQALVSLDKLVISRKPDLAILKLGINDAYSGFEFGRYEEEMLGIIQKLKNANIKVLLLSPTPIAVENEKIQNLLLTYCQSLKDMAVVEKIAFFHLHKAILDRLDRENQDIDSILPDKVHFASDKYEWIAEVVFAELEKIYINKIQK